MRSLALLFTPFTSSGQNSSVQSILRLILLCLYFFQDPVFVRPAPVKVPSLEHPLSHSVDHPLEYVIIAV
jgi:hypothetical protein